MQIVFYSEDTPEGLTADWPTIPHKGEMVQFSLPGGENTLCVDEVLYHANSDGGFHSVSVHLTYEPIEKANRVPLHSVPFGR
jgi:hypothetical protein